MFATIRAEKTALQPKYSPMPVVLIVDDEPLIRWSVAEVLETAGYGVVEAGSKQEALALVQDKDQKMAIAVLDLKLPDSCDLSLLHSIRKLRPSCAVILMTAHGTQEILDEALAAGASRVLTKPFDVTSLAGLLQETTERTQ
jgi:DNA-binding NtrC family response regulator